jgi:hypothetical protein
MKNDLTRFEKDMLKSINFMNDTKYTHKNFMEWSNDQEHIRKNMDEDDIMYKALGFYVAIKPDTNEK